MSDYEVLKECKQAYEILNDLVENCDLIGEEDTDSVEQLKTRNKLKGTMEILSELYSNVWELLASNKETYKQLETNVVDRFGHKVIISDLIDYAYLCQECDENNYSFECSKHISEMESEHKQYVYEDFDTLEQAYNELLKYAPSEDYLLNEIKKELANDNENINECNELIKMATNELNYIIRESTNLCWWNN